VALPDIAAILVALGLSAYVVLGGADFGTGIWDLTAGKDMDLRARIKRSMAPVWEANHVWLIFILVVLWTAFPRAFGSITSTLALPLFLAAIGIILRGAAFALRGEAASMFEQRSLGAVFALSSLLVPFFLGAAVGGVAGERVPEGNAAGDEITSWLNGLSLIVGALGVVTGAHIAAVFLGADARRAGEEELVAKLRTRALISGVVAGAFALAGLLVVRSEVPRLWDGLTSGLGLVFVLVSAMAGLATLWLEWTARFEAARWVVAVAVGAIVAGWVAAQQPYMLPPELTVDEAAAGDATLTALLIAVVIGLVVLVPSLTWLFRLTLRGQLDKGSNV
jgi:cytochrome bd ubiquinol oxidase subunit II